MLNEKLQNDFMLDFHNLTKQNARKILEKIKSGETDFFDNEIQNNFILWLNPLLDGIKNNWEKSLKNDWFIINPDFLWKYWGSLNSWIWESNFPYYNTPKVKTLERKPEHEKNIKYKDDLTFKPEDEKNIKNILFSDDSRKIASNIYDEQVDYFKKVAEKYKNEDNFLDIIWKEFKKITDFNRVKNYGECLADTIFQSNKNSYFNAYLEDKKIKWYKKRVTESDDRVSDICRHNASQGFIPFEENFISWHDTPPWHYWCRCHLEFKTEENLDFNIENYILKNKQITDLIEEERIQKEQEKREKEAEKEKKRKEREKLEEEKRQKFIEENEGNVWYLDSSKRLTTNFPENVGHAALYYIYEWEEYILSYSNWWTENIYPSQNGDIFLDEQPWIFIYEDEYITNSIVPWWKQNNSGINYDVIEIGKESIDVEKMHKWIEKQKKNPPNYNVLNNNCSIMVEKALESWDFIVQNFDSILPTPHNLNDRIEYSKMMYQLMENWMWTK